MSSPSLKLQCRLCSGIFATPKVDFDSLVKCPHCSAAAPAVEFEAVQDSPPATKSEPTFSVRGKWLQFDCPHCVRPMRLVVEDAGGLVDCAHCGLELIAPDPAIGRGAKLSRASEGRVSSVSRVDMRDIRNKQLSKPEKADEPEAFGIFEKEEAPDEGGDALDPNHALARSGAATAPTDKRAVKALEPAQLGKSFRQKKILAQEAADARDDEWSDRPVERPAFGESKQDRFGFWIALGVAGAVMAGIIVMVVGEAGKSDNVFDEAQLSEIQIAQREQAKRFDASFTMAKEALASPTWEALAAHVRDPDRVTPLMREFYAKEAYSPIELVDFHAPLKVEVKGLPMHEMRVNDIENNTRTLVIEESGSGSLLDWELMVNLPAYDWNQFLESRPSESRTVRVIASRSSVLDKYFADAGLEREHAVGFHLWQGSADGYYAVIAKDTKIAKALTETLNWDKGRKIIVEASFDPESEVNDRLQIKRLIQTGWIID